MANAGILHPGQMGTSVAASAQNSGHRVYWVSVGRSLQTRQRAEQIGLYDAGTLDELCRTCEVIISVCPPHAAEEVAEQVAGCAYQGTFIEANAISPQKVRRIAERIEASGASFVDGGIIGPPAWEPGKTWLYLSGEGADRAAAYFSAGPLQTCILDDSIGRASAFKMCYAGYTKGTAALLSAILAASEALGVREALVKEWSRDGSDFAEASTARTRRVTAKAWRFAGEMEEIADTFREAGLPGGFHAAAGEIYRRMENFKEMTSPPELEEVLKSLLEDRATGG